MLFADRVKETTSTTGTGGIDLNGASLGYQPFSTVATASIPLPYCVDDGAGNWEVGRAVLSGSTLIRNPVTSSNENNLVNFGAGSKDVFLPVIADTASQLYGRNLINNGNFDIWQRGTSFATLTGGMGMGATGGAYTADRWYYSRVNASPVRHTVSQSTLLPPTNPSPMQLWTLDCTTNTNLPSVTGGDLVMLGQKIEGVNWKFAMGRPFVMSWWQRDSITGTHCVSVSNAGGDKSCVAEYTVNNVNQWEYKTVSFPAAPTGGTWDYQNNVGLNVVFSIVAGKQYTLTGGSAAAGLWQNGLYYGTSNIVNGASGASGKTVLSQVQLEVGRTPTPFEFRPIQQELAACQRYCNVYGGGENTFDIVGYGQVDTTSSIQVAIPFPVTMRKIPVLTAGGINSYLLYDGSVQVSSNVVAYQSLINSSKIGCFGIGSASTTLTVGRCGRALASTGACRLTFSAEL